MAKQQTADSVTKILEKLPTTEQLKVQAYIQKVLDEKKSAAEAEVKLIEKGGKEQ